MIWLKVRKHYRGGRSKNDYLLSDPDPERQEENAKDWAEHSEGGHCYGWTVYWEEVEKPPEEWLKKEIASVPEKIEDSKKRIRALTRYSKKLEGLLEK